jgi:MFS family permease
MNAQDQALLMSVGIGLVAAVIAFFARRRKGKSRAMAVTFSVWIFGAVLAFGILSGFVPVSRSGMGLERWVAPMMIMIAAAVMSAVLGLVVHLLDNQKIESAESLPLESQILIQEVDHEIKDRQAASGFFPGAIAPGDGSNLPEWKRFAINAANRK